MKLTNKRKCLYLSVAGVLLLLFIYYISVSRTIEQYSANVELKSKLKEGEDAPGKIEVLQARLNKQEESLSNYIADSIKNQEYILEVIGDFCQRNNVTLKEFPKAIYTDQNDFIVETNIVKAEGTFTNLLKIIYALEQENKIGRIAATDFRTNMDHKRNKLILTLTLYLQNIRIKQIQQ